tara:strand:+ start:615 stop:938 length:324 start_codon:yes stop_codon:yes gene_type:complete
MNDYIYESDVEEMNDHILLVNLNTIKNEIAKRKQDQCNKFYSGQAVAVTTNNGNTYPARVVGINKASIKVWYTTDKEYNPVGVSFKLISSDHIKGGYVRSAMPSAWK